MDSGIADEIDSFIIEQLSIFSASSLGTSLIEISSNCFTPVIDVSFIVSSLNDTDKFLVFSNRVCSVNDVLPLFIAKIERKAVCLLVDETLFVACGFFMRRGNLKKLWLSLI